MPKKGSGAGFMVDEIDTDEFAEQFGLEPQLQTRSKQTAGDQVTVVTITSLRGLRDAGLPEWSEIDVLFDNGYFSWDEVPESALDAPDRADRNQRRPCIRARRRDGHRGTRTHAADPQKMVRDQLFQLEGTLAVDRRSQHRPRSPHDRTNPGPRHPRRDRPRPRWHRDARRNGLVPLQEGQAALFRRRRRTGLRRHRGPCRPPGGRDSLQVGDPGQQRDRDPGDERHDVARGRVREDLQRGTPVEAHPDRQRVHRRPDRHGHLPRDRPRSRPRLPTEFRRDHPRLGVRRLRPGVARRRRWGPSPGTA